ncbi:hypothetical protein DYB36_001830 [Aphanomyces astaci]|uniref:Uncharacterized protein n=1 Tax=Aphanomyces astaci TaxID=112090 RepID=A0A397AZS7_APHAT|nr:hypothetical protein DYB36_001830 [Aphanomyces astaci]
MSLYPMTSPTGFVVRGYPAYLLFESDATVPRKYIGPPTPKAIETWLTNTSPLVEFDSIDEWTCYVAAAQEPIALVVVPDLHSPDRLVAEALAAQSDVGVVALRAYDWAVDGAGGKLGPRLWVYDPVLNTQNLLHQLSNQHTQPIVLLATMNVDAVEYQSLVQVVGGTRFRIIRYDMNATTVFTSRDLVQGIVCYQDGIFNDLRPYFRPTLATKLTQGGYYYYPRNTTAAVLHLAIARNDVRVVQRLLPCRPAMFTAQALDLAASFGHLDLVRFLHAASPGGATTSAMDSAAQNGHLAVVIFLHEQRQEGCTTYALNSAIRENHIEVVRFLVERRTEGCSDATVHHAAATGKLDVLRLLHDTTLGCFSSQTMDMAAAAGQLQVVKFLHCHRPDDGCSADAMDDASRRGFGQVVRYLHDLGKTCTTNAMDDAAANGHLDIVQFLHNYRHEGCTTDAMNQAARNGHLNVVTFLHTHRKERCTVDALNDAASFGHAAVVGYLKEHLITFCDMNRAATLARRGGHAALALELEMIPTVPHHID